MSTYVRVVFITYDQIFLDQEWLVCLWPPFSSLHSKWPLCCTTAVWLSGFLVATLTKLSLGPHKFLSSVTVSLLEDSKCIYWFESFREYLFTRRTQFNSSMLQENYTYWRLILPYLYVFGEWHESHRTYHFVTYQVNLLKLPSNGTSCFFA